MGYLYLKAIHIIFVVTWFAGLFYMPRLLIYNVEANNKPVAEKEILQQQFKKMMRPLWYGITWPSAIITLIMGLSVLVKGGWLTNLFEKEERWLLIKLLLVILLYAYHFSIHKIFKQQLKGIFNYSSQQLRMWNEVATLFLISIIMLVVVKSSISFLWGMVGIILLIAVLMAAIRIYKKIRERGK